MHNIHDIDQLQARVQELELQQDAMWADLKNDVHERYENLKPANLIKNAFSGITDSLDSETDILKEGAALVSGLVANALLSGSKNKPLKRWITLALFSAATYLVTRYQDEILEAGNKVMHYVTDKLRHFKANRDRKRAEREAAAFDEEEDEIPDFPEEDMDIAVP
jgi:hypothetical protein